MDQSAQAGTTPELAMEGSGGNLNDVWMSDVSKVDGLILGISVGATGEIGRRREAKTVDRG